MLYDIVFFVAMISTALALGAALAHAFALPNKIHLPRDEYFIAQKAYQGWSLLGYLLAVEFVSLVALMFLFRWQPHVMWGVAVALACLVAAQAIFWIFTYPANVATQDWTVMPDNWDALRWRWEYSHLAGAILQVAAMSVLIVAALARSEPGA